MIRGAVRSALAALALLPAALFAEFGCLETGFASAPEGPVPPFSLDTNGLNDGGWVRWQTMEPGRFHSEWFLRPRREALLAEGRDCALMRGHMLAESLKPGDRAAALRTLELLGYAELAEPEVRRLTMDDAIRALEVLGREREVDSLVERAAKADSGTSWAAPSSIRMAMRRAEPILRMDVAPETRWAVLDSLRETVVAASGLGKSGRAALDDSLRFRLLEAAFGRGIPGPKWRAQWSVSRLNSNAHFERSRRLWAMLEADSLLPGPGDPVDRQIEAAKHLKRFGFVAQALERADAIPAAKATKAQAREIRSLRADLLFRQKKWDEAGKIYAQLAAERPKNDAQSLLQLARCRRNAKKNALAEETYADFRERYPSHSKTAEMCWTKAQDFEKAKKWDSAGVWLRKIDGKFRNDRRRSWVGFRLGLLEFKQKRWEDAARKFDTAAANSPQLWPHGASLFFEGEAWRRAGRPDSAKAAFLEAIADYPVGWYAHLARKALEEGKLLPADSVPRLRFAPAKDERELARWLRTAAPSKVDPGAPVPAASEFRELELLVLFHEWKQAERWTADAKARHRNDPYVSYRAARTMMETGAIAEGYREARRLIERVDRRRLGDAPLEVMRLFYPRPYWDWVKKTSEGGADPYFQLALVRQESIFDDQIASPVGAIGLGQLMTYTAEPLARSEQMDWYSPALLRNPLVSLRLSARYLRDLFPEWNGDPRWVLANYNAGPGPTKKWAKELGKLDWASAGEEVSYWETCDYIKRVMGNYWTYQAVWGGEE